MKTTNYLLQTTNLPNKSQKPTNYQLSTKLINFKTRQVQQILFCSSPPSVILSSIFQLDAACCMPCDTFMQKKHLRVFCLSFYILHSVFCSVVLLSVVCCCVALFFVQLSGPAQRDVEEHEVDCWESWCTFSKPTACQGTKE